MGTRCMHRPRAVYPGSLGGVAAPFVLLLCPCVVRHTLTGPTRIPCSVVPPPRSSSSTYRILGPVLFLGLSRLVISSYPPRLPAPLNTRPSRPSFCQESFQVLAGCVGGYRRCIQFLWRVRSVLTFLLSLLELRSRWFQDVMSSRRARHSAAGAIAGSRAPLNHGPSSGQLRSRQPIDMCMLPLAGVSQACDTPSRRQLVDKLALLHSN